MGNRAVITTEDKQIGIYLHWNGGRDSVEAFLMYCKIKGYRAPDGDNYGWARLCQVIGNYLGGGLSIGIDIYNKLDTDNGDNGVYIIRDWDIVGREFSGHEQKNHDLFGMLCDINNAQPITEQLTGEELGQKFKELNIQPITSKQIKAIHAVVTDLKMPEENYRALLTILFNVTTCKDLTEQQASILIDTLNKTRG